ncbi:MAG: polysaccharide biosynthesis tyrosine autokinase [Ruminococcus flavefaciens]|nr:polysaccharide biosynthesis tyrosine autokinase [Ruminococcus flavefaciens]MCM1061337.1 polysaccharide biosynthesis tyrosine autokinase [Eubacterium sp.]
MNNNSISIADIFKLLWSKSVILLIALIIGAGAAFGYTKFFMPLQYSSHISMYVQSYTGISNESSDNYNDISKSKQLINTYIEVLKDDAVMESVGNSLTKQFDEKIIVENFSVSDGKIKPSSIASAITISTVTDTSAINIVATTKNAKLSAAICNELCRQANQFTTKAIGVGEIKSIDTAKVYNTPVAPNMKKNTIIGGLAGLMLSVLIILLIDFFDNTVKSAETLSNKYERPILGEIEEIRSCNDKKKSNRQKAENSHKKPAMLDKNVSFNVVESYKSMRTNLLFALSTSENKTFVISSANPNEGKSTTAVNIAITLAQSNNKVLLCDGDLRKPVQAANFGVKNKIGLSSLLSKMSEIDKSIHGTDIENLDLLPSGEIPPNPSELLGSARMEEMLKQLSERYDYIIIDAPPINVVSDALNVSRFVAGIMMVVKYGSTTFDDVETAMNRIQLADMKHLGFVLNDIQTKYRSGYYSKYGKYQYKYGYGNTETKTEESI